MRHVGTYWQAVRFLVSALRWSRPWSEAASACSPQPPCCWLRGKAHTTHTHINTHTHARTRALRQCLTCVTVRKMFDLPIFWSQKGGPYLPSKNSFWAGRFWLSPLNIKGGNLCGFTRVVQRKRTMGNIIRSVSMNSTLLWHLARWCGRRQRRRGVCDISDRL